MFAFCLLVFLMWIFMDLLGVFISLVLLITGSPESYSYEEYDEEEKPKQVMYERYEMPFIY